MTKCLFCGGEGATKEHVLSLAWLHRLMPGGEFNFVFESDDRGTITTRKYTGQRPEITTKGVCAECNSGWMNRLDLDAQPMLTTMIKGRRFPITELPNKMLLAQWVCKIAILLDSMLPHEQTLAPEHAEWLFRERIPPQGWSIWLACLTQFPEYHTTLAAFTLIRPEGRGYIATVSVNHLVIQALVLPPAEAVGNHPAGGQVAQLWPPSLDPLDWPPAEQLADPDELAVFARLIAGERVSLDSPPPKVPLF